MIVLTVLLQGIYNSYWNGKISLTCQPIDYTIKTPQMNKLIFATYLYYSSKYVDLLDTVRLSYERQLKIFHIKFSQIFFVLRKKFNQITFLHVYHHGGMIFAVYIFCKFLAGLLIVRSFLLLWCEIN